MSKPRPIPTGPGDNLNYLENEMGYLIGSIVLALAGFLILCIAFVRYILNSSKVTKMFERYQHHGNQVWVRADLRGTHRDHCLCFDCKRFRPGTKLNCRTAQALYEACVKLGVVTPVWECPTFLQDPFACGRKHNQ